MRGLPRRPFVRLPLPQLVRVDLLVPVVGLIPAEALLPALRPVRRASDLEPVIRPARFSPSTLPSPPHPPTTRPPQRGLPHPPLCRPRHPNPTTARNPSPASRPVPRRPGGAGAGSSPAAGGRPKRVWGPAGPTRTPAPEQPTMSVRAPGKVRAAVASDGLWGAVLPPGQQACGAAGAGIGQASFSPVAGGAAPGHSARWGR